MDKDFENKLLENVLQTGFPLELQIVEQLRASRHLTFPNVSFLSEDETIKELDIISIIQQPEERWTKGLVGIQLLIECKKSGKYPWVFFEEVDNPMHIAGLLQQADVSSDFYVTPPPFSLLTGAAHSRLNAHHYNNISISRCRTYYEAFKEKQGEPTAIFKSVMNIMHGRKFLKNRFSKNRDFESETGRTLLNHYCIVVDGTLIVARKEKVTFSFSEPQHLMLLAVDTISDQGTFIAGHEILIDVIQKNYFDKYLSMVEKETTEFCYHLKSLEQRTDFIIKPSPRTRLT